MSQLFGLREVRDRGVEFAERALGVGVEDVASLVGQVFLRLGVRAGGGELAAAGRGRGGEVRGANGAEIED